MQQAEHCAEGAAGGDHDLYRGAFFHSDDHASGDADGAGGAQRRVGTGDFQYRAPVLGKTAQFAGAARSAGEIALEHPADRFPPTR